MSFPPVCVHVHVFLFSCACVVQIHVQVHVTVDVNSQFSPFQFSAFWSNGLVSQQQCERQKCERHQCEARSANANSAKETTVRMRQKCDGQVCEGQECECDFSAIGQNSEMIQIVRSHSFCMVSGGWSVALRRKCVGLPRLAWSKKFARADHHDILEKRRLGNADADSTRASESRRSHPVEFYWSQTSSTANARAHRSTFGAWCNRLHTCQPQ